MIFNSALTIICMRTFNGTFSTQRAGYSNSYILYLPRMGSRREAETFLLSAKPPMMLIWSLGEEDMVRPVREVTMVSRSSDDSLSTWDTRLEPEAAR